MKERLGASPQTEPQPPSHRITLNRTGNLSQVTALDKKVADEFMRRAGMRRDIVIVDSDMRPEADAVAVGSDTLAWRAIEPITRLTEITFRPKPFHTLTRRDGSWEVAVHERVIDKKVREDHPIDRSDYDGKFLGLLNQASKQGLTDALTKEKLGLHDQMGPYVTYLFGVATLTTGIPVLIIRDPNLFLVWMIFWLRAGNPAVAKISDRILSNYRLSHSSPYDYSRAKDRILFPVHNWISGSLYLARHGDELIVPKE